jgi:putative CRISPR-associated protein (TIGR02619 family)
MPKTFLCSTGTSAAKLVGPAAGLAAWVAERGGVEQAAAEIFRSFAEFAPEGAALHEKLSAEIHSLAKMNLDRHDRVVLLASATDDGCACALAVEMYLKKYWDGLTVVTERIAGLQVRDARLFRQQGVVNYLRRCLREVHDYGRENVVLNPTGGFKALVPYAVLIGMLKRVPCRYIFEQSQTLLELPPLPVEFQRGPFEAYRELFQRMEREAAMPAKDWDQQIPFEERPVLEPLIERHGSEITISDVGFLFLEDVRSPTELVPFLSTRALSECLALAKLPNRDPFRFLLQVARAAQRGQVAAKHEHVNVGQGLRWLKPGNTTDRYLVSVEGWRLLVWRAVREDEVGEDYPTRIVVDPRQDRDRYTPFIRMELWS